MVKSLFPALLLSACLCLASCNLPLPSYIKACSRNDPDLNGCSLKSARETLASVFDGDKKYKVPPLDPFKVDRLEVNEGHGPLGLAFVATDALVRGIRGVRIDEVTYDLKGRHVDYKLYLPKVEIDSNYNISGKIILLPIEGAGKANLTLTDVYLTYSYNFTKQKKDGIEYGIPQENHLDLNTSRLYIHLDNLFDGDKLLGDSTNQALDDNWPDVMKSVGPIVAESIGEIMRTILTSIFELVPFDVAFPE